MNTFTESMVEPESGVRRVLRYMVFASDEKPKEDTLGGFQYDHDDLEYVLSQLREEALSTEYTRFEILDTETFRTYVIEVEHVPDVTYRVMLNVAPADRQKDIMDFLKTVLTVTPKELPLFVKTCPSFIGQRLTKSAAQTLVDQLTAVGATAVMQEEAR